MPKHKPNTNPYAHHTSLPYAHEPYKTLYTLYRLTTTLLLVPYWALLYTLLPRSHRPRASWSLRQIINVNFTRRIYRVTEVAGVTWGTRDPGAEPRAGTLRETRFEWVEALDERAGLRSGVVCWGGVEFGRVGVFVWPRVESAFVRGARRDLGAGAGVGGGEGDVERGSEEAEDGVPIIGVFMHGGGYCHMSAHESSRTSRIPRGLIDRKIMHAIYAPEYRLIQHAPFPAVVQDAAAVYAHLVLNVFDTTKCRIVLIGDSSGGNLVLSLTRWIRDEGRLPMPHGLLLLSPSCDASHAIPDTLSSYIPRPNANTDYLVDTPEPRALLQRTFLGYSGSAEMFHSAPAPVFLSGSGVGPSQTPPAHPAPAPGDPTQPPAQQQQQQQQQQPSSSSISFSSLLHSEYISPCSPLVLRRWGHAPMQDPEGVRERRYVRRVWGLQRGLSELWGGGGGFGFGGFGGFGQGGHGGGQGKEKEKKGKVRGRGEGEHLLVPGSTVSASASAAPSTTSLGADADADRAHPSLPHSVPPPLPLSTRASSANANANANPSADNANNTNNTPHASPPSSLNPSLTHLPSPSTAPPVPIPQPVPTPSLLFPALFDAFPRTMVVCGDAERLTREVGSLVQAMGRDLSGGGGGDINIGTKGVGVGEGEQQDGEREHVDDVTTLWARDACHDILIIAPGWWDREVVREVWEGVGRWVRGWG